MRPNLSQYYTAHRWAVLVLYCSSLSSCGFHVHHGAVIVTFFIHALYFIYLNGSSPNLLLCILARPRPLMASMPLYDIIIIHYGIVQTSLITASCQLYSFMSSSCDFHNVLYLYSGIWCHSHTPVGLCCYEGSMRPYKVFLAASLPTLIAASCRLYLRHYCRLDSSSHRTTCGITADLSDLYTAHLWAVATSMSSYIFIVASMPLPHSCGIMLPWKQYETIQGLSCGITTDFDCGIMPTLLAALLPTRFVVS
jgi:hypothetical protein